MKPRSITPALGAVVGFLTSCGALLGTDDYRTRPADAGAAGPIEFKAPACDACADEKCDAARLACEAEPECRKFATCYYGCASGQEGIACVADCRRNAGQPPAMNALVGCTIGSCWDSCHDCGRLLAPYGEGCGACGLGDGPGGLCTFTDDCAHDDECRGYMACLASECEDAFVPDPACRLKCSSRYPAGSTTFYTTVGIRYFSGCREPCGGGRHCECDQPVSAWPPLSVPGGSADVTLRPGQAPGTVDNGPFHVRACPIRDQTCARVIQEANSGPTGTATLSIPQSEYPDIFGSYFEITYPNPNPLFPVDALLVVYSQPVVADITLAIPPDFGLRADLDKAAEVRGDTVDWSGKGFVSVTVVDCVGGPADFGWPTPDVAVAASSGSAPYYGVDFLGTGGGLATFANVPPGTTTIEVTRSGKSIATATVPVRKAAFTYVYFNAPNFF